jgi:hypothetical protein
LFHHLVQKMRKLHLSFSLLVGLLCNGLPAMAQTTNNTQPSTIGDNSNNNLIDNRPVQNANSNTGNSNFINIPSIYPLPNTINTPVNTENDFGFNASVGMNTLNSSNVTVYVGVIYQPGRTDDHNQRMARLRKETEVLEMNKRLAQTQLTLLEQQIEETKLRLEQTRRSMGVGKKP